MRSFGFKSERLRCSVHHLSSLWGLGKILIWPFSIWYMVILWRLSALAGPARDPSGPLMRHACMGTELASVCVFPSPCGYRMYQHVCRATPLRREPAESYIRRFKVLYVFEHKTQYRLIHDPYTRIVVFGYISSIPYQFRKVKVVMITPCFVQPSFGCYNVWANLCCSGCSPLGEKLLWNGTMVKSTLVSNVAVLSKVEILGRQTDHLWWVAGRPVLSLGGPYMMWSEMLI